MFKIFCVSTRMKKPARLETGLCASEMPHVGRNDRLFVLPAALLRYVQHYGREPIL